MVTIGIAALGRACQRTRRRRGAPFARAATHVLLVQHLQHGRAGEPREDAREMRAQRDGRQHQVPARIRSLRSAARASAGQKSRISRIPRKKFGRLKPSTAKLMTNRSIQRLRLSAATMPRTNPATRPQHEGREAEAQGIGQRRRDQLDGRPLVGQGEAEIARARCRRDRRRIAPTAAGRARTFRGNGR